MPERDVGDALDRLLADVARARASQPVPPPDPTVVAAVRARGTARRRRRLLAASATLVIAAVVAVAGTLIAVGGDDGQDHDVEVTGSTSTVPGPAGSRPPAIGADAPAYGGLEIRSHGGEGSDIWTVDGRPLTYLTVADAQAAEPVSSGVTALLVRDGDAAMLWLLAGSWPGAGTVVDAVDLERPADGTLGADCSSETGDPVVAVVRSSITGTSPTVVAAWRVADGETLRSVPPTGITCSDER